MFDLTAIKKKNICIMGLMGSGKSMIGKDLSKFLNLKYYDTDKEIELKTKKSIRTIFEEKGETYFRNIEEKICIEILNNENCVISLGGGSVINKKIRKAIRQNSYSIYLQVKVNNLLKRLKFSNRRPLLNTNTNTNINININKKEILENLYNNRHKYYEKANLIINNDKDKYQVLEKIKSEINKYAN